MSDGQRKPTRIETTAKRRQQILEAAIMCFLETGYHQTGVRDIANRAGVSLGNLYNHFPGKHDVLVEIASLERAELVPFIDGLAQPRAPMKLLENFVRAYAKYLAVPENVILGLEITSEAIRKPDIARLFLDNRRELVVALAKILERGRNAGDMRSQLAPNETAQMIVELIEGSAYRSVLENVPMRQLRGSLLDFILAAVRSD
ncbi:TetR/AcrR family transcriptional regulator [Phaeobacter gallaeciensis]|uniref:Transcriptional regulator, TetR family n=1 Tax=Phaeobacter gallaeciensis TaxID=60890 RepID=A0AAD0EET7_9RHOB|nr:TetR/AcrR family transcriptional regulator [Phaeobacter gallaeciensis]AHD11572.1 transcriptional regulator, TetR family [Phaeobacter gallaeciensis DSM 26640]ATE94836.1 transcriptional regulator, TetR family [Phaeobacter gallaeciensis]ATE99107.1 transcriptional regulator, TetR family [Phaeobacter gallaeciensis]ATF03500.1 transcriptional regulator, TetR family [Phaeobacter gallaeciensis]ATF07880.1 transcriptional regulator, TetR family [Phaeobacter gallaeciensis]